MILLGRDSFNEISQANVEDNMNILVVGTAYTGRDGKVSALEVSNLKSRVAQLSFL